MSWRERLYALEVIDNPAIADVVDAVGRTHVNGGMICRCFRPLNGAAFASLSGAQGYEHSWTEFFNAESVRAGLPEFQFDGPVESFPALIAYGIFEFEGAITQLLLSRGAYVKSELTVDQARAMARRFVEIVLPQPTASAAIFRVDGSWNAWFCEVAWDHSFLILDCKRSHIWLICVTDTD